MNTGYASKDKPWRKYYTDDELNLEVPDMSLTDYITKLNKDRLYLTALNYLNKKITYEELLDNIDKTSKRFQALGVKEEDYVSLAMPLTPETIYFIYGLDKIGANANLIDPRIPEEKMRFYLNLAKTKLSFVVSSYAETMINASRNTSTKSVYDVSPIAFLSKEEKLKLMEEIEKREIRKIKLELLKQELFYNLNNAINKEKIYNYSKFEKINGSDLVVPEYRSGKTSVIEYTSGTTGVAKGLGLTSVGMNTVSLELMKLTKVKPGETILCIMPPFISYGAACGIHNSLSSGLEMILIPNFKLEEFANLIYKYKPNNIICVPSFFESVISNQIFNNEDLSYLNRVIFGGDKTPKYLEERVNNWLKTHNSSATLIKGGGMAEFSSCTFLTPFEETKKPEIYGIPLPLVDAKIMKDDYTECRYNEIGEIYISSVQRMSGYLANQSETEKFFFKDENGQTWGRTGDLGYVTEDGLFVLTDRKKNMIVRPDGHNVFPNEIEEVIKELDFVKNCVVIGVRDEKSATGCYPYAFVEIENMEKSSECLEIIKNYVNKKIPLRDRPRNEDYLITKLIYKEEGKVDRQSILKLITKVV